MFISIGGSSSFRNVIASPSRIKSMVPLSANNKPWITCAAVTNRGVSTWPFLFGLNAHVVPHFLSFLSVIFQTAKSTSFQFEIDKRPVNVSEAVVTDGKVAKSAPAARTMAHSLGCDPHSRFVAERNVNYRLPFLQQSVQSGWRHTTDTSAGWPISHAPTVRKWDLRPWSCWVTECRSRKRRSNSASAKIALAPAAS